MRCAVLLAPPGVGRAVETQTSSSSVIGPFNYELMQDQGSEIDLLKQVLARYPGQMSSVPDDPRMMEIMHRSMGGMAHGMGPEHGH